MNKELYLLLLWFLVTLIILLRKTFRNRRVVDFTKLILEQEVAKLELFEEENPEVPRRSVIWSYDENNRKIRRLSELPPAATKMAVTMSRETRILLEIVLRRITPRLGYRYNTIPPRIVELIVSTFVQHIREGW